MTTYLERATEAAANASVAVQVLMGAPDDIEMIPLRPRMADEKMLAGIAARWPGRGLRTVGVIGLHGTAPVIALNEPLEPEQVDALASAFLAYLHVLLCDSFEAASVSELEHMFTLQDTRLPN